MRDSGLQRAMDEEKGRAERTGRKAARLARPNAARRANMDMVAVCGGGGGGLVEWRLCGIHLRAGYQVIRLLHLPYAQAYHCRQSGQKSLCCQLAILLGLLRACSAHVRSRFLLPLTSSLLCN